MGLVISRKAGEAFVLSVDESVTPEEALQALRQGITVTILETSAQKAGIHIDAPDAVDLLRAELCPSPV